MKWANLNALSASLLTLASLAAASGSPQPPASSRAWHRDWTRPAGAALASAPAALNDGWVAATENGRLTALDNHGRILWTLTLTNTTLAGSPALAGNTVITAGADGQVTALDAATGSPVWQTKLEATYLHGPLTLRISNSWQVVLLCSSNGVLQCLDAARGRPLWTSKPTNRSDGAPATDGQIIAYGNCDAAIHLFEAATGASIASIPIGDNAQMAGGVLVHNGRVYGGTRDGQLVCVDTATHAMAWKTKVSDGQAFTTPVAAQDTIIMGSPEGLVTALSADTGKVRWQAPLGTPVSSLCVLDDSVFAMAGGRLSGLRLKDGTRFIELPIGDSVTGPTLQGGKLAVSDDGGMIITLIGEPKLKETP
jgi:outer membrane protein assembly factor BamB